MASFHARASSNLKGGVAEARAKADKKMQGNKRGKYNHSSTTKREDDIAFVESAIFKEGEVMFKGQRFLELVSGGHIPVAYKEPYLYVCTGQARARWTDCLAKCKLLSVARVEGTKQARH